ncbi:MAG: HEAT repeat domain-containing protein [Planctomycetota bacterium]
MRQQEARAIAQQGVKADAAQQEQLVADLARRIQNESDPLVRETILESVAVFPQPLADDVLRAGLSDEDAGVRLKCCQAMGKRANPVAIPALAQASRSDEDLDVRIEATRALGNFTSPQAVQALAGALEDSRPALQYAGVQAMRSATGQDLGNSVDAYLAVARGEQPPAVASKPATGGYLRRLSPF